MNQAAFDCDWYFDVLSPFSYLQWKTRERLRNRIRFRPVPVVFGAILDYWGQKGPAEIAPKRTHTYRICQWRADKLGIPFRFPPRHPFNPLGALRLIVALNATEAAVETVFDAVFKHGHDVSDLAVLENLGRSLGMYDVRAAVENPEVKQRLRANTAAATARGVFGVPTIEVGGELFWGEDSADMALDFLADRGLFATPEMQRLSLLPSGIVRRQKPPPA